MVDPGPPPLLLLLPLLVFLALKLNHERKHYNKNMEVFDVVAVWFQTVSVEAVLVYTQQFLFPSAELLLSRFNPLHPKGNTDDVHTSEPSRSPHDGSDLSQGFDSFGCAGLFRVISGLLGL